MALLSNGDHVERSQSRKCGVAQLGAKKERIGGQSRLNVLYI